MVLDRSWTAIRSRDRFDLSRGDVPDAQTAPFALSLIVNRRGLDTKDFAYQWSDIGKVSTRLPREDFPKGLGLRGCRTLVQIESDPPFGLEHVARRMDGKCDIQTIQRRSAKRSLLNVPGYQYGTGP